MFVGNARDVSNFNTTLVWVQQKRQRVGDSIAMDFNTTLVWVQQI